MRDEKHKKVKAEVGELLKRMRVSLEGNEIPLLNKCTNQIVINCNDGEITDLKPAFTIR